MLNTRFGLMRWIFVGAFVGLLSLSITMRPGTAARQLSGDGPGRPSASVIIHHCVYYTADSTAPFRTELRGIETSEGVDLNLEAGSSCADAISKISLLGYAIASSTSVAADFNSNGVVDAADYVVWRKTDGHK